MAGNKDSKSEKTTTCFGNVCGCFMSCWKRLKTLKKKKNKVGCMKEEEQKTDVQRDIAEQMRKSLSALKDSILLQRHYWMELQAEVDQPSPTATATEELFDGFFEEIGKIRTIMESLLSNIQQ